MPSVQQLETALINADKAGDAAAARALAAELKRVRAAPAVKAKPKPPERSWLETAGEAIQNAPASAVQFGKGLVQAAMNPIDTAGTLWDAAAGGVAMGMDAALPKSVNSFLRQFDDPKAVQRAVKTARQVGGVYAQRYGSEASIKNSIATDPVGVAADLSMVLSGGAGLARGAAKLTGSNAMARAASGLTKAANVTNPMNAMAPVGRGVAKAAAKAPAKVLSYVNPKAAAYVDAVEGKGPQVVAAMRAPDIEIVPGSLPTAAEAASSVGATKFSALGESAAKVLPSPYYARQQGNEAARLAHIQQVGQTPAALDAATAARSATTRPLYQAAEARSFRADPALLQLADDPYIKAAMPDARTLSKSQGVTFKNNPVKFVHNVKISLDKMLTRTGDTALANTERAQVMAKRNELVNWLESKAPEYGAARASFAAQSKPINQMQVGQYLEGKLTGALDEATPQRATVFGNAVKDAPGTLKRATSNEARFKELAQVLEPEQVKIVMEVKDDLTRAAATARQAKAARGGDPRADRLATNAERAMRLPNLLSRITAVANHIMDRLKGAVDQKLAIQLATEMLDPHKAAAAVEKALKGNAKAERIGYRASQAAQAAGAAASSPAGLAGAQVQNAMAAQDF